ncbi:hypothetical protein [Nocardia ignorata]|uniref:HNH endonuclease n=1 Tax=Nocardia ignorata TaxID=145285 RepID=A0A4R6PT62_NOCIG|nr:hypothetical protein [Nocardia ignorata]TDP41824.1 hypothetical protein DFR75_101929 [Nocardia ignorata]
MAVPNWNDPSLGSMKRVGLWLVQEIGEGELFSKQDLRDAFPSVSQVDRRLRDLRDFGWRIDTNREDPALQAHEQRFVTQGEPVWEPGKATRKAGSTVTAAERHQAMSRDGHMCRSCGIGPGETYPGTYIASQLDVARRPVKLPTGQVDTQLVIECTRCRVGRRELVADLEDILTRIASLPRYEQQMLAHWVKQDSRTFSEAESLWAAYRTLPANSREKVREALG